MNKNESKYFATAELMDEALIDLLDEKDIEYITVKEICRKAGVNRSTFYLHYESIWDLMCETRDMVSKRFQSYFDHDPEEFTKGINGMELSELVFITPDFLFPYLRFISDNKKIFRATLKSPVGMQTENSFGNLKSIILDPIFERFNIPEKFRKYYYAYYIRGTVAIISEWVMNDCADSVDDIARIIEECVRPAKGMEGRKYGD